MTTWTNSKEFDIDTHKKYGKWKCSFYHNNHKVCETAELGTKKEAESVIMGLVTALDAKDRPADISKIVWNAVNDWGENDSKQYQFGNTVTTYAHCDHDPNDKKNIVFELNGVKVIGATKSKIEPLKADSKKKRLIINCSGFELGTTYVPVATNPIKKLAPSLKGTMFETNYFLPPLPPDYYGDEVLLDWGDQKAAPVRTEFWKDLLTYINMHHGDDSLFPYNELIFCCIGGHGRTGTAIASLAIVAGIWDDFKLVDKNKKPIPKEETSLAEIALAYTKHLYCKSAIESDAQVGYLERVEEEQRKQPA